MSSRKPKTEDDLAEAVKAIVKDDPEVVRLSKRIQRAQRRLQKCRSPEAWQAYLTVEEATNERDEHVTQLVLKYGLTLAGRYAGPRS